MMIEQIRHIRHTDAGNFFLIAGPCVIESPSVVMETAQEIKRIAEELQIPFFFKSSYRKANRSRWDSFTGIGDKEGLSLLSRLREELSVPVVTDIHSAEEAVLAAEYVDVLQIPAFLARQSDILVAAAHTGKVVNIKKGQFMSPESMQYAAQKVAMSGNDKIMLTDRGTMFGYHDLLVDFRGIPVMQQTGYPVVLDITHSLQQPNQQEGVSGGLPAMIETIARAGVAVGVDGLFVETHPNPENALSDGTNMLPLHKLEGLLRLLLKIRRAAV